MTYEVVMWSHNYKNWALQYICTCGKVQEHAHLQNIHVGFLGFLERGRAVTDEG